MRNHSMAFLLRRLLAGIAIVALPGAILATDAHLTELPESVQKALERNRLPPESLSVYVQAVDAEIPLIAHRDDVARNPASVMKVVTTLAGLEVLGPGYRWTTRVYVDAPIRERRLQGNLYLKGGGDPYLVTEKLWQLLRRVRAQGLVDIDGDLVVDNSYFDVPDGDPGAFDQRPFRSYNALPAAMLVNFKSTRFDFWPDRYNREVRVTLDPPSSWVEVRNRLKLVNGRCNGRQHKMGLKIIPGEGPDTVRFRGDYPAACGPFSLQRTLTQSSAHVFGAFDALWREMDGTISGGMREGAVPEDAELLVAFESDPLSVLIRGMNKFSNNVMTRQLLLTLGAEGGDGPGTLDNAREAVAQWLIGRGLDPEALVIDNGSGLSRDARASARLLGTLLLAAYRSPLMPEFMSSLPLAAVDGTLRRRFDDGPLAGRMHLKTGLIDHVRSIAGYVVSASGNRFVVVMLHNHKNVHQGSGTRVQDALLDWLHQQ